MKRTNLGNILLLAAALAGGGAGPAAAAAAPLTLDDALSLAASQNAELLQTRLHAESAGVDTYASYANILPRLDLSSSFGRSYYGPQELVTTAPVLGADPATGAPSLSFEQQAVQIEGKGISNFSLGLRLVQPIFDGLRGPRLIERSKLAEQAAQRQVDEAVLTISFDVTRRFYEVVKADRSAAVLAETVQRSEDLLARSEALFEAGRLAKSDVIAARVNLGNDRMGLETQRARAVQTRAELAGALGLRPEAVRELAPPADVDRDEAALQEPPTAEALLEKARASRPTFARAQALLEQAQLDEKIASAEWWPTVTGLLSYDRAGPNFAGNEGVWGNPARQFVATAQLSVQYNLFNGRQTIAHQQQASIARRSVQVQAE
ncbi:MAG: TolC family protein [Deltaproteobacteria bacterium]|nr:TolC family protein [Deltaproteobacteria bacterium]